MGDLELQVVQGPPAVTAASDTGNLIFTIINHGPDPIGFTPSGPPHYGISLIAARVPFHEIYGLVIFFPAVGGDIVYWDWVVPSPAPDQEPTAEFIYVFPVLQPGESWTQTIEYQISPVADEILPSGHLAVPWTLALSDGNIDPNPANDTATLFFNLAPPPARVPTLSPVGMVAMVLGLVMAFAWVRRRRMGWR